jgi:hypothetical protein
MEALPSIINYSNPHAYLPPDSVSYNSTSIPINGSTFTDGKNIEIQLPKTAFLIPDSLYIKYQLTATTITGGTTAGQGSMIGAYTAPFLRVDTYCGGKIIDTIQQYNLVNYTILNTTHSPSEKVGLSPGLYGTGKSQTDIAAANDLNYTTIAQGNTLNFAGPFPCMLSNCKKALPLFAMSQIKFIIQLDYFANFLAFDATAITASAFTISNVELCYELFNPGHMVMESILREPKLNIKTKSFLYVSQPIVAGTSAGTTTLNFNVNINSIKSCFLLLSSGSKIASTVNGLYDFIDVSNGGDYQLIFGGGQNVIPQKPLSVSQNMAGILTELRKAVTTLQPFNTIFDKANNQSITNTEFSRPKIQGGTITASTAALPDKFIVAFHTEKLYGPLSSDVIFSGISSNNQAIIARINIANQLATTISVQAGLLIIYDALLEIDNEFQQVNVQM